jgi:hypothetical protein
MFGCKIPQILERICSVFIFTLFMLNCSEVEKKWSRKFDALGTGSYRINSISCSKDGIYVTGTYTVEGNAECFTAKYTADGKLQWCKTYETLDNLQAQGKAILVLRTQEELLTGHSDIYLLVETHDLQKGESAILVKYDTLGEIGWQKTVNTSQGLLTSVLMSDHEGSLYVAGWEINSEDKPTIFALKFNESGETAWSMKYYNEQIDFNEVKFDIMDPRFFVLAGLLKNTGQLFYIRYDGSGQFQELTKLETETGITAFSDLKIDPAGNMYISGTITNPETGDNFLTVAYDKEDNLLWSDEYDGEYHGDDMSKAIVVDESLNVYVTGTSEDESGTPAIVTVKYDTAGNRIWTMHLDKKDAAYPLMIEPRYLRLGHRAYQSYFYIAGTTGNDALILRCNTSGVYSFQAEYGERGTVTLPTALSEKCMALERTTQTHPDAFIVKYGPSAILGIARWD